MKEKGLLFGILVALCVLPAFGASAESGEEKRGIEISGTAEIGVLRSLIHTIQIGENGYELDYIQEGGQELLLPFSRFEVDGLINERHEVALLYQPLTLRTRTRVDNPGGILVDDIQFADDSPLNLQYGFDFYRGTYRYRIVNRPDFRFSLGGALQIRNASIIFDGFQEDEEGNLVEARAMSQDLGPVPVVSMALRKEWGQGHFVEASLDGFYAPIRYLNLRDVDVIGWLYDGAIRVGTPFYERSEIYLSFRVLGGGSDGTAADRVRWTQSRDEPRYTRNSLTVGALSIGVRL